MTLPDARVRPISPKAVSAEVDGLVWKTGNLGHLGGILDSDSTAGAAKAVARTAKQTGSLSSRLDSYGFSAAGAAGDVAGAWGPPEARKVEVCPEIDSLVNQLASGKGEFFDYIDDGPSQVGCVMCMRKLHETALYEGRHEVKVLPCFHSVCAQCLQSLSSSSEGDAFDCPRCGRRTQKMQALHQYLPNFDLLHNIDSQKVAQSDFLCEECVSGYRAETYCEECIMNLCESCTTQHRRRRATASHMLVKLVGQGPTGAEVLNIHRAQYCAIHRTSRYELYCEDCERLICNECARTDHQHHVYKLPSASLIEKHRQRVKDIIEALCNKLLDDQALLKLLGQSIDSSEVACMQARSNISSAFDELKLAAEQRCAELMEHLKENSREPMSALIKEKETCSTALVDLWCVIDFMEKVNKHGTDVEVLMAKSHLFRDPIGSQKFQEWFDLCQAPSPGFQRSLVGLPNHDADSMLRSLASFGSLKVNPLAWEMSGKGPLKLMQGQTWADVFEESEELHIAVPAAPIAQNPSAESAESEVEDPAEAAPGRRRRRRRRAKGGGALGPALSHEPAWVESKEATQDTRMPADMEMEPQKVSLEEDESTQEPQLVKGKRRRRRRPRGKGGGSKVVDAEEAP